MSHQGISTTVYAAEDAMVIGIRDPRAEARLLLDPIGQAAREELARYAWTIGLNAIHAAQTFIAKVRQTAGPLPEATDAALERDLVDFVGQMLGGGGIRPGDP